MARDWMDLTELTKGERMLVERVRLPDRDAAIEGSFELPPLARLTAPDQMFVAAFVQTHGNIRKMESLYGVSYPTIKNRLNRISAQMGLVEDVPVERREDVLQMLERGEISVDQALEMLK